MKLSLRKKKTSARTKRPEIFNQCHEYGTLIRVVLPNGESRLAFCSGIPEGMACSVSLALPDDMRHIVDSDNVWDHVTYGGTEPVSEEEASEHFGSPTVGMPIENWPNPLPKIRHVFRVTPT